MIPIARPDLGPEELEAVRRGARQRDDRPGAQGRRARGTLGRVRRGPARDRDGERHRRPDVDLRGNRPRARRRGDHGLPHVRRDRERDPLHRRDAGLRRHRARHVPHRREEDRGRDHAADQGDLPGPPLRARGRHGHDPGDRRPPRAGRRRGRLPGPRRDVPRSQGRQLRPRCVQPLRDEEHDDRRGRLRHDRRRPAGGLAAPVSQPGHAVPLPVRDPRLQLPADRPRGRDRARPVRQARRGTPPAARRSPPATTTRSATCRSACRSRRTAGPTSSTSTRSTSVGRATRSSRICARPGSERTSTTRSPSTARSTSWSGAFTRTCR